ncbi:anaerobic ribonucleoside-triphosphate reductase [Agaribacterium haliotis]|uniref:anaerobic ribonucleoside-triphosphate reductase n=1 Tax=Agaribacterium haliotis TaxID=2013869 RepID=UPI000BB58E33|nr:anaerobic ribonucleoside-triphosphate reductase [Agaribacterium haliotis]
MDKVVIKRDGSRTPFDVGRIEQAILKAMKACKRVSEPDAKHIALAVAEELDGREQVAIDEIQALVERRLMQSYFKDVARRYIEYRHERDLERERSSRLTREIQGLVEQNNSELLNENANKDSRVIPTQRDLLAGIVARHFAKTQLLPKAVVEAHDGGFLHYHDLDYAPFFPMFNCMLVDLKGMLENGFKMGNAEIESPKSISTACSVTAQIIAQVASHIYGGTTINRIDEVLAPYVELSYQKHVATAERYKIAEAEAYAKEQCEKECYNAFQALEYEINTLHTSNGQTPFVTFGFGLGSSWQEKLIQRCILEVRRAGLGKHKKTAVFPKLVFAMKRGLNAHPEDPNYDIKRLALRCASERMYPDILNYEQVVEVTGSFKTPMGCRSFLSRHEEQGQEVHEGRNNLGVVSLNLPRLALLAKGNMDLFYKLLHGNLELAFEALMTRVDRLRHVKAKVAPILYTEGACGIRLKPEDSVFSLFENGRASVSLGYIGLNEVCNALLGHTVHVYDCEQRKALVHEIVACMSATIEKWKQQTGLGFSLYATPSENLCSRFCRIDSKDFGLIPGVTDKGYYTNSFHLDVQKKVNPFDKLDFEKTFPPLSSGGFICYGEYPNLQHNLDALEDVWDYSYDCVPYYGTNTPIDECYDCGFTGEFDCTSKGFCCPQCGNSDSARVSVTRRVCGYLGSPDARPFNDGKQQEVLRRVKHLDAEPA